MSRQAERVGNGYVRRAISTYQRSFDSDIIWHGLIGIAALTAVASAVGLVVSQMPKTPIEVITTPIPKKTSAIEPTPIGRSLTPSRTDRPDLAAFLNQQPGSIDWIDCSNVKGIRGYADSSIGSSRFERPSRNAQEIKPAFPKSEPLRFTDLISIKTAISESLWGMNPQAAEGRMPPSKFRQDIFILIEEVKESGIVTRAATLVGDPNSCDRRPLGSK